ncbi:PKD domain-containing protein [Acidobacterium sp. S8]|uniref:PKD domain-containing protein n=1 Tax=Acidobacterium sp. S8 TaxID=1641854 RepID=UPI00131D2230|nr:PKD domain-containing protein [Acidobacterium sp. S8]
MLLAYVPVLRAYAALDAKIAPIPAEVSSNHFIVSVNASHSPVMHAAGGYYLLNFDLDGPAQITVTASDTHYWDAGVEVQPMRLGIRPHREGASITFPLDGPTKLSITRPGEHFGDSEMLFLFANAADRSGITAATSNVRYYGPGVHRENIDAHSGDNIYLAAGAVIFGSLNIWQVHDVHVSGRGTIIYDGPQNPSHDEGWMHKPNWHVIVMDNARNIDIEGITGIVRSRTWMVQMRDSRQITFRNVKIIGNCPGNANQDGMDWLGGGDTLVQDSFFRASDDIFAMYGNWDGYSEAALTTPGHEVSNITIDNSILSTSISNVVRVGWPRKIFDSHNFTLRNSDVIHAGFGGCGIPFALFEIWADPGGKGSHSGYHFDNIRLEDWYSLAQLRQPNPKIRDVTFTHIWAMNGPGMVPSALKGDVAGVSLQGVNLGQGEVDQDSELPLEVLNDAKSPQYEKNDLDIGFSYTPGLLRPGMEITFTASGLSNLHYRWLFGDGTTAEGQTVKHAFPDADGTLLEGSGSFRILLYSSDGIGREAWYSQIVVISDSLRAAQENGDRSLQQGLIPVDGNKKSVEGFIRVPADGGYAFTLLTSTTASLMIDGVRAHSPVLRPQVCGSPGNAVQPVRLSLALARGLHRIQIMREPEIENADVASDHPFLLWQGPELSMRLVPETALFHTAITGVARK